MEKGNYGVVYIPPKSPWDPKPAGVYTAVVFGLVSIGFLVEAYLDNYWLLGAIAILSGALAVHDACEAAFHAGMRAESYSKIRRELGKQEPLR